MADDINQALDDLDSAMLSNYEEYEQTLLSTWETFSGNSGQLTIVADHLIEAVSDHIKAARELWPYGANPNDYKDLMYEAFDSDVMERAFSDTIETSFGEVYDLWNESMDMQHQHETMLSTIGSSAAPHSTDQSWKGG